MKNNLAEAAKAFKENPGDVEAMTKFLEQLAQANSIGEIAKLLPLDYERMAGHIFLRLIEIVADDADLYLSIALWYYHFGLDDEAHKYFARAKQIAPSSLPVLQTEIYMNYGQAIDVLFSLCHRALKLYPADEWLRSIERTIENTGKLEQMKGPPFESKWQKLIATRSQD